MLLYCSIIREFFLFIVLLTETKRNTNLFLEFLTGWLLEIIGLFLSRNELDSNISKYNFNITNLSKDDIQIFVMYNNINLDLINGITRKIYQSKHTEN